MARSYRAIPAQTPSEPLAPDLIWTDFDLIWTRAPNPPKFAQPLSSRSNGGHPQREGTSLGVFVPIWLVLPMCEATSLGVFDLCHFALLKRGCANSGP